MLRHAFALLAIAIAGSAASADDGNPAYTSAADAPIDYRYQGEYLLSVEGEADQKVGVQVIALGEGKFDAVGYHGGLPGAGWMPGNDVTRATGALEGDTLTLKADQGTATVRNGEMTVRDTDGTVLARGKRIERTSPTLGAKPPEGAIVLFDGSTADGFEQGKLIEGNLLGATNCTSKETLGDHVLHLEFRTPFMPLSRGQGRGNSGVYMQSRYELQVLDSFGLSGENNECGGIYSISKPAVNMCLPPLSWQTYDIEFTAARYEGDKKVANGRATIRHNGVVIHDDLELTHGTPGCQPEGAGPLGLFLQDHGNPVAFRNIWVVKK
ncbi:MAG TPA: DUF1080 domain-containing protein [Planctomycetaceae bacterium]|nr:DUF1080 domain-containing protein [Planctomycetaceae bacterium]HRF00646.1 DUF1080 domain-containing protein [Pirellulaceae bacterium]